MREDRNNLDRRAAVANIHATIGMLPSGRYQTREEACAETRRIIETGPLSQAIHPAQDMPGHNFESMENFGWNWSTAVHVLKDIFPTPSRIKQAYQNTLDIINARRFPLTAGGGN